MIMDSFIDLYQQNLKVLNQTQPDLAATVEACAVPAEYQVVSARNGMPVLRIGRVSCHSVYDPVGEALKFVNKHLLSNGSIASDGVLVFGLGFAYHLRPLLEKDVNFVIFEPALATLKTAMKHVDLTDIFQKSVIYTCLDELPNSKQQLKIWPHLPTAKCYPEEFERLKTVGLSVRRLSDDRLVFKEKLKILVVSPIYGGSLPVAGYCVRALEKMGHQVEYFDASIFSVPFKKILNMDIDESNRKVIYDLFQHLISEMVLAACSRETPDILLALAQAPVSINALERLKRSGVTTAFWFVEDYRHMDYWKAYAPCYDFYFTIQKDGFFRKLDALGLNNYHYLPMAADPDIHCPMLISASEKAEYGSVLSFMGAGYHNRQIMFSKIKNCDFKIWGNSWDPEHETWKFVQKNGQRVGTDEIVKIFNASEINLNLHSYAYDSGINPEGDFVNPRTFEIAACGGFQLVDDRSYLKELFTLGEEIVCFHSESELFQLIRDCLANPEMRKRVSEKARQRVLNEHTYVHRMQELVTVIREKHPDRFVECAQNRLMIRDKSAFVNRFPETGELFARVPDDKQGLTMDVIKSTIKSSQKDLTYPEAIFLLMDEFQQLFEERQL